MIDYTIPGTVLPEIAEKFPFRAVDWENSESNKELSSFYEKGELISYGSKIYKSEVYILADKSDYEGRNYLMLKLEDLNKLTKQENMEDKKLIGYKCPTDLFNSNVKKDTIYVLDSYKNLYYPNTYKNYGESLYIEQLPKEIVETWEPVYEEEFKADDWVFWRGMSPTFAKIHKYNGKDFYTLNVNGNINSHDSCHKSHLRKATQEEIIKAQEQKVDICGIELTIKDNKVFHDKDNTDITEYVKAIKLLWESTLNDGRLRINNYDFIIDNISIKKTGCRTVNSDIKAWLNVAKMIK